MPVDVGELYRRHGPMVVRRCRRLLRDEAGAVDVAHDVFVRVLQKAPHLEETAMASYLYTAATRACLNAIRARQRRPIDVDDEALSRIAALDDLAGETAARLLLARVFAHEPPSTRVMAVLHHVDGLTYDEVAAVVGLSASGVRRRLRVLAARAHGVEEAA